MRSDHILKYVFSEMATAIPTEGDKEDNHLLELKRVREKIKAKFAELTDCLKARENQLLLDLDNVIASYLSFQVELEKVNEKKRDLETTKKILGNQLLTSPNVSIHCNIISLLNTQINSIETPVEPQMVTFECDSNKMFAELYKLAKLVNKVSSGIDHGSKRLPLVSVCERGKGMKQLDWPRGVTVDNKTGKIYIADQTTHCVKVFDSSGKYLFKFGDNKGEGKMSYPRSVAIYRDRILITQSTCCVLNYQLNGMFISRTGVEGKSELEFGWPLGLTIDESNGNVYICELNNNRVQILYKDFSFKTQFGKYELNHPLDVKLSKEYIYVLDDYDSNCINIYSVEFQLIHRISVSPCPMGIAVDFKERVIVVCQNAKDCLQIF